MAYPPQVLSRVTVLQQPATLFTAGVQSARRVRGELAWVVAGQAVAFAGNVFAVKMLTSVMGAVEYGKLAFGITLAGALQMLLYGPLGQAVFRYLSVARERQELSSYLQVLVRFHRMLALVVISVAAVSAGCVAMFRSTEWALVVLFACLYGLSTGVLSSFAFVQNALRQRKIVALHQGVDPWLRACLGLILLYAFWNSGYFVLLGFFISAGLLDLSQFSFARRNSELRSAAVAPRDLEMEKGYVRELLTYASPYLLASAVNAIALYGDRWTLQYLFGTGQLGIYAALCQIANAPVALTSGMIMQLMIPVIFDRAGTLSSEQQQRRSGRLLHATIVLFAASMLVVGTAFYFFGETVVGWISTSDFAAHYGVLWVIFLGMSLFQLGQQATVVGQVHRSVVRYLPCYVLNAIATLVLSFSLGKMHGMTGVALGLLGSNCIYLVSVLVVNRRFRVHVGPSAA